jgi:hypothetical protein
MHAPVTALLAAEPAMPAVDMRSQAAAFPTRWGVVAPVAFTAAAWVEAVASTAAAVASVAADTAAVVVDTAAVVVDTGKI